jgi:hypothetical protein
VGAGSSTGGGASIGGNTANAPSAGVGAGATTR